MFAILKGNLRARAASISQMLKLASSTKFKPVNNTVQTGRLNHVQAGQFNHVQAGQLNHVQAGQLNHVQAGQFNHVQAGQPNNARAGQFNHVQTGQFNHVQACQQAKTSCIVFTCDSFSTKRLVKPKKFLIFPRSFGSIFLPLSVKGNLFV